MTSEEIAKESIEKAQKNGYKLPGDWGWCNRHHGIFDSGWGEYGQDIPLDYVLNTIIFSHEFAKAFFGGTSYLLHLARMVQGEEPLKYLEKLLTPPVLDMGEGRE